LHNEARYVFLLLNAQARHAVQLPSFSEVNDRSVKLTTHLHPKAEVIEYS
jgi:hypothetical protein